MNLYSKSEEQHVHGDALVLGNLLSKSQPGAHQAEMFTVHRCAESPSDHSHACPQQSIALVHCRWSWVVWQPS